jgi:D-threo-aldose 1-dehydrogenase
MPIERPDPAHRTFKTNGGRSIEFTTLGFGSGPLGNYLRPLSEEDCDATLATAWDSGMRYFDTAPLYGLGLSEQRVGRLLQQKDRAEFTIATKVGRLLEPCEPDEVDGMFFVETPQVKLVFDYSYDGIMRSYEESLKRLGLDSVDILYAHDICAFVHGGREGSEARIQELIDTGGWRALTELRDSGAIAAIGAGVNEWQPCARLLELVDPDIFLIAGRYTLLEQEPIDHLFPQCFEKNAAIVVGGPYNSGILAGLKTYNYTDAPEDVVNRVRDIEAVCRAHDVPLIRAALHFIAAHPLVASVIPGGQNVEETTQNATLLGEPVPAALWDELKEKDLIHPESPTPS